MKTRKILSDIIFLCAVVLHIAGVFDTTKAIYGVCLAIFLAI